MDCLNDILTYFHDRLRSKDVRKFKSKVSQKNLTFFFFRKRWKIHFLWIARKFIKTRYSEILNTGQKIEISTQKWKFGSTIEIWVKNWNFGQKSKFWDQIEILGSNRNFGIKSKFCSIQILDKNQKSRQKSNL